MPAPTQPPAYYARVAAKARATCQLLDDQPDLSGAWELLFEQIQNPRVVISELLQNADDAGATEARVTLSDAEFVFSHNGQDFNEDQFASLCRFGFSNKRTIHTIGFRGIGFKSTFSLGDAVEVWTPTLGVSFPVKRFIEPHWIHDGRRVIDTQIRVRITNPGAHKDLSESLVHWTQSPASLLFFNNIRRLTLNGLSIERTETKTRIPHTFSVELAGETKQSLYLIRSAEEPFPPEAMEEIRRARRLKDLSDLNISGCEVEVVLGLAGDQHLFVVLPTGEPLTLPFSVNAPFLLKPDRFDIKPPSTSPTNQWLLDRAARLVADVMIAWLADLSLPLAKRLEAYRFLPDPQLPGSAGSLSIRGTLISRLSDQAVILNSEEKLCMKGAVAIPAPLFEIWSAAQVREMFSPGCQLLSPAVDSVTRHTLARLGWVQHHTPDAIVSLMRVKASLPKPDSWRRLALLWQFVLQNPFAYDYDNSLKRSLPINPVVDKDMLLPAGAVVRVSSRTEALSAETVQWLTERTAVLDLRWPEWLSTLDEKPREALLALLRALQLHEPTPVNRLVEQTANSVFAQKTITVEECVQLAQLFAALRAVTPKGFKFATRDLTLKTIDHGLVYDVSGSVTDYAPESWARTHLLHDLYGKFIRCTEVDWTTWVRFEGSGLHGSFPLQEHVEQLRSRPTLVKFLESRNSSAPTVYHYKRDHFLVRDFNLDDELLRHWTVIAKHDPSIWREVLQRLLSAAPHCWKNAVTATAFHDGTANTRVLSCPPITAQWITVFRDKACLFDMSHQIHLPTELYRRTPDTEALQGSRDFKFVQAELDIEATRPVLRLLGVLDTPADYNNIVKRLTGLSSAPITPAVFSTVSTYYQVLDRIVARCRPAERIELESIFSKTSLILASDQSWQTSGELSVFPGDEEEPDAATFIHPAFQGLAMWTRLGVTQQPSASLSLDWLLKLESGQKLDGATYKRVRRALARDSVRVWEECGHWMSLDSTWEPTERFTYRLTMQGLVEFSRLLPGVKQCVADLRPVATALYEHPPFADLRELATAIETTVTRFVPGAALPMDPAWLGQMADSFRRVKIDDPEKQTRVRVAGERLLHTRWRAANELEVTPYIDKTPAGPSSAVKVAWVGKNLHVLGGSAGRLHRPLVEELSRPFALDAVAKAFDSCAGRDENFIADYLAEHFVLDETADSPQPEVGPKPAAGISGVAVSTDENADTPESDLPSQQGSPVSPAEPVASDTGKSGPVKPPPPVKPPAAPEPSVFDRYAASLGFKTAGNGYAHADGRMIVKASAPFHWEMRNTRGVCIRRFWSSRDRLEKGVEVAAEVWTLTHQSPASITWVMGSDDREFVAMTGHDLSAQTNTAELKLYPASYRLVSTQS